MINFTFILDVQVKDILLRTSISSDGSVAMIIDPRVLSCLREFKDK